MHRLFVDGSYRGPLALQVIAAHVTVALLRRWRVPLLASGLATAAVAVLVLTWARFPDTVAYLLPTGNTLSALGDDLDAAWRVFQDVKAPAPVENGFIVATGTAIWLLVFVADWAAFRARAAFEALLPATTLFLFAAALGAPGGRVAAAAVFAAACLVFVLLHRTLGQEETSTWAAGHRAHGRWSLLGTGAALTGIAVIAGAIAGPRLPGADADAVLEWKDIAKDEPTRVVPSPMTDLRTRLVDQPNIEVFTVRSPQPSYWRLTALDQFDGRIWRSSYGPDDADGELPRSVDSSVDSESVTQTFTIIALSSVWLPAAFEPTVLDAGDTKVGYDEDSSTLMVDRNTLTSDGFTYEVTSSLANWDGNELRTASDEIPEDIRNRYLGLPDELSPRVYDLAEELTAGAPTPYDKAMALQDYLHTFTYDANIQAGHSTDALESFLFGTQRGYCEQFSGAFAALARAADLPSRVAIGFTWGAQDPEDPTIFRVRGIHAHAWPEVYLDGFGWVPFEPTPGRGPPRAGNWLGLPEAQDSTGGAAAPIGPGTDDPAQLPQGGIGGDDQRGATDRLAELETASGSGDTAEDDGVVPSEVREGARAVGFGFLAYLVVVPIAIVALAAFRRRRASRPADKVRFGWRETAERAAESGIPLPASLTVAETAQRLATELPDLAPSIHAVARTMEKIAYAELPPSEDEVAQAQQMWREVVAELNRRQPWWRRVLSYLDVRQLRRRDRRERLVMQHYAVVVPARH
jgi:transglutaminase-like putative cysteine protease